MDLFNPCSWRMHLLLSTDTKLNKSHSSITCLSVLIYCAFCCPDPFLYYPKLQLSKATIVWLIQNTSIVLKLQEDFWNVAYWHSKFFSDCSLVHILGHLHYLHLGFFGNFTMISSNERMQEFDVRIYPTYRKKNWTCSEKTFDFYWWDRKEKKKSQVLKNFTSSLHIQNPC